MTFQSNLEINGNLREYALAELLAAIADAKLNGSLRLADAARKAVVYFDAGDIVFAVSNARQHRLYEFLLRENKITKERLAAIPDFTSDMALRGHLTKNDFLPKAEIDEVFARQIAEILREAFLWRDGEWTFSPLVRIKGDIRFKIDAAALLVECARNLPVDKAEEMMDVAEFAASNEVFAVKSTTPAHIDLLPEEAFVFSRFENASLDAAKAKALSGLPEAATFKILRTLWLGGFLARPNYQSPISERNLSAILSANLTLKKSETPSPVSSSSPLPEISDARTDAKIETSPLFAAAENKSSDDSAATSAREDDGAPEKTMSLEEYLEKTEAAPNFYSIFEIAVDAPIAAVKQAYFARAKRFHPDLFYKEVDAEKHRRIQNAFTKIARAYDTLKNENLRQVYDYKMRKELAEMENPAATASGENSGRQMQTERAAEDFERGFGLFLEGNSEDAAAFLARAAHLAPDNARYRAYFGKALSIADARQKHKAEAEMQAAIRLDPNNADFRIMLAEFFAQMQLVKRAEGELNRLLSIFPSNTEAKKMLADLKRKQ